MPNLNSKITSCLSKNRKTTRPNENYIIPNLESTWNFVPLDRIDTERWTSDVHGYVSGWAAQTITAQSRSYNFWTVAELRDELTQRGYNQTEAFMKAIKGDEPRRIIQYLDIGITPVFTLAATEVFRRAQTSRQLASSAIFIHRVSMYKTSRRERTQEITNKSINMAAGFKNT